LIVTEFAGPFEDQIVPTDHEVGVLN